MSKIVVIGSLNMDIVISTPRVPELGETLHGSGFQTVSGGKGANQAFAAARLGADVTMIGSVGNDSFGDQLCESLASAGVDVSKINRNNDYFTGVAVITICDGNNSIILDAGSNASVSIDDIDKNDELIMQADAIMLQLEIPMDVVEYVINKYKGKVRIMLNPAPAKPLSDLILNGIDYLTPNEIEVKQLCGIKISGESSAFEALDYFKSKGVKFPVITMGSMGVAYFDGKKNIVSPARKIDPVDTTAAGDTFSGGFTHMICSGKTMDEAVSFAQSASAIAITRKGAQSSIPLFEEVERYINENK